MDQAAAIKAFEDWARTYTAFSKPPTVRKITSWLLPFWGFSAQFSHPQLHGGAARFVAGPALQCYAGSEFPRAMLEVAKNPISKAQPFHPSLLDIGPAAADSRFGSRAPAAVEVEPFETYEATAWSVARAAFVNHMAELHPGLDVLKARFDGVESHRVLFPVHVVEYRHLFEDFRVFINGATGQAFGVQQQAIFGALSDLIKSAELPDAARAHVLPGVLRFLRELDPKAYVFVAQGLFMALRFLAKFLLFPPFLAATAVTVGAYAAVRGSRSIREQRSAFAQWREEQARERTMQSAMNDEWVFRPSGRTKSDFRAERAAEEAQWSDWRSRSAGSASSGGAGSSSAGSSSSGSGWSWSSSWGSSSRSGTSSGAGSAGSSSSSSSSSGGAGRTGRTSAGGRTGASSGAGAGARAGAGGSGAGGAGAAGAGAKPKGRVPPPVKEGDYYALLGLSEANTAASTEDIQKAFRRELMRYHPDHQQGPDGYDAAACSDRTRQIIEAYGVLRDKNKRSAYNVSWAAKFKR